VAAFNAIFHAPFERGSYYKGKVVNVLDDIKLKTALQRILKPKKWVKNYPRFFSGVLI